MAAYEFIKDYKNNTEYRLSFNRLAKKTFGIDFEAWYQDGFWGDSYICYSYLKDGEVISNVSLSTMELIMDGRKQRAIQIGTVMTNPEYRRQGLAYQLLQKIFEDYDTAYDFYFLAADEDAVALYEKCGFKQISNNQYIVDLTDYQLLEEPLKPLQVSKETMLEVKRHSQPLSNVLSATGDEHVLMFYYTLEFKDSIYRPQDNVYTIFEIDEDKLNLYDILSPDKVNLEELIQQITPKSVKTVICHFTPDQPVKNLMASIDASGGWMIRATSGKSFPNLARFPRISQT